MKTSLTRKYQWAKINMDGTLRVFDQSFDFETQAIGSLLKEYETNPHMVPKNLTLLTVYSIDKGEQEDEHNGSVCPAERK